MNFLILTAVLILCLALLLSRYFFPTRVRPFARLMEALPADHSLCAVDQCVKEYGHIWFFWSLIRVEDQLRLTVSLNVPHPDTRIRAGLAPERVRRDAHPHRVDVQRVIPDEKVKDRRVLRVTVLRVVQCGLGRRAPVVDLLQPAPARQLAQGILRTADPVLCAKKHSVPDA